MPIPAVVHSGKFNWVLRDSVLNPVASSVILDYSMDLAYPGNGSGVVLPSSILDSLTTGSINGLYTGNMYLDINIISQHGGPTSTGNTVLEDDSTYIYTVELDEGGVSNNLTLFIGKPCGQVIHCSGAISQTPSGTWINTSGLNPELPSHIDETIPGYNGHPSGDMCLFDYNRIYQSGNISLPEFLFTNDGNRIRRWSLESSGLLNTYSNLPSTRTITADPVYKNFYYNSGSYLTVSAYNGSGVWVNSASISNDADIIVDTQRNLVKNIGKYSTTWVGRDYTLYGDFVGDYFSPVGEVLAVDFNPKTNSWYYNSNFNDSSPLQRIKYSPDQTKIATGRNDGKINISNANDGTQLLTLIGHTSYIFDIRYNNNGTQLVSASNDNTVKIWDTVTGNLVLTYSGHTRRVNGATFSPDGTKVISVSDDNTAQMWDAVTGQLLFSISGEFGSFTDVAFNPDGTSFVLCDTISAGGIATIHSAVDGQILFTLNSGNQNITSVDFSSNNRVLTVMQESQSLTRIKIWNSVDGQLLTTINVSRINPRYARFSKDNTQIIVIFGSVGSIQTVYTYDVQTGNGILLIVSDYATDSTFIPEIGQPSRFATCSSTNIVRIYNNVTGSLIYSFSTGIGNIASLRKFDGAYSTDNVIASGLDISKFVYCDINNTIYYNKNSGNHIYTFPINGIESTLISNTSIYDKPVDFAIDAARNRLYWSNVSGYVNYSDLAGSGITRFCQNSGVIPPYIALDCQNGGITFQSKAQFQLEDVASGVGYDDSQQFSMAWTTVAYETSDHPTNSSGNNPISGVFDIFKSQIYLPYNSGKIWETIYYEGDKRKFEAAPVNKRYYFQNSSSSGVIHVGASDKTASMPRTPYYSTIYRENNSFTAWNSGFLELEVTSFNLPYNSGNSKIHTVEVVGNHCIWPNFGQIITNAITLYIQGPIPETSGIDLFIDGVYRDNSGIDLYLEGPGYREVEMPLYIHNPVFSGTNTLQLFLLGPQSGTNSGNFPLFIQGGEIASGDLFPLFIGGTGIFVPTSGLFDLYLMADTPIGDLPLFIEGFGSSGNNSLTLHTFSIGNTSSGLYSDFSLYMNADFHASLPLFIGSPTSGTHTETLPLYIGAAYSGSENSLELFVQNSNAAHSGAMELFLKVKDDGLYGSLIANDNMPLYISRASEGDSYWFPMSVLGPSGLTNSFDMFVAGGNFVNSGMDLYLSGIGVENKNMTLFSHGF